MYIPSHFEQKNSEKLISFIREFPFGILISAKENIPWATHVPFVVENKNDKVFLTTHISRANPQNKQLDGELLVIFREPHAYISPEYYEHKKNVPTWNYIAVHAYGKATFFSEKQDLLTLQEKMIKSFDPKYMEQWNNLPEKYVDDMLKGITGFEIEVTKLYGKEKLSQNKTENEQRNISEALEKNKDTTVSSIGKRMKK